jgi:hypothetical protein
VDPNEGFHWLYFSSHTLGLLAYSFMLYILHLFVISNRWTVSVVSADDTILEAVHEQQLLVRMKRTLSLRFRGLFPSLVS